MVCLSLLLSAVRFGEDEFSLVMLSFVWCCWVWFGVVVFGLVWLSLVWFQIDLEILAN